jgi:hypothetical protein
MKEAQTYHCCRLIEKPLPSAITASSLPLSHSHSSLGEAWHNSYLCTYGLYGSVRNAFDAGSIHYEGKWEGVGPWKSRLFWAL